METLAELYSYNAWANRQILDACATLDDGQSRAAMPAMYGSVLETVSHLVGVEFNYLRLIRGEPTERRRFDDLAPARERCLEIDQGYVEFVGRLTEADLARVFHMPMLGRDLTVRQALIQVATHSTEHRADLAAAVTRLGGTPPPLDYVQYLAAGRAS